MFTRASLNFADSDCWGISLTWRDVGVFQILPIPGEAKAKAMPGRLYIHTRNNNNKNK